TGEELIRDPRDLLLAAGEKASDLPFVDEVDHRWIDRVRLEDRDLTALAGRPRLVRLEHLEQIFARVLREEEHAVSDLAPRHRLPREEQTEGARRRPLAVERAREVCRLVRGTRLRGARAPVPERTE